MTSFSIEESSDYASEKLEEVTTNVTIEASQVGDIEENKSLTVP